MCHDVLWEVCLSLCGSNSSISVVVGFERGHLFSCVCSHTHVIRVSFTKAMPLGYLVPSLKFCLFQDKVYLWKIVFSCYKNSFLWLFPAWKENTSQFLCVQIAFLTFLDSLVCNCQHSQQHFLWDLLWLKGHTSVLRASPLCHFPHRKVLLLHSWD